SGGGGTPMGPPPRIPLWPQGSAIVRARLRRPRRLWPCTGTPSTSFEPTPPGPPLGLALVRELPGDCLSLIAPSGRLSAPSVTINANVSQLLAQQYLDLVQRLDLSRDRRRARSVIRGFHARTVASCRMKTMAVRLDVAAQLCWVDCPRAYQSWECTKKIAGKLPSN